MRAWWIVAVGLGCAGKGAETGGPVDTADTHVSACAAPTDVCHLGDVSIRDDADVELFCAYTCVEGSVEITGNDYVDPIALPWLEEVTGDLRMNDLYVQDPVALLALREVGGDLWVWEVPFFDLDLPSLERVGAFSPVGSSLQEVSAPLLTTASCGMRVVDNGVTSLAGLPSLASVGVGCGGTSIGMEFTYVGLTAPIADLPSLTAFHGDVVVNDTSVISLAPLAELDDVVITGVSITGNTALSTCEAVELATGLDPEDVCIYGNKADACEDVMDGC